MTFLQAIFTENFNSAMHLAGPKYIGFRCYRWVPWYLHFRPNCGAYGWLKLGRDWYLNLGSVKDEGEFIVCRIGQLFITRPETLEEQAEREYDECEANYQDWCSSFYSY